MVQLRAEKEGNAFMLKAVTPGEQYQQQSNKSRGAPNSGPSQKEAKTPLLDTSHASRMMSSEGAMKETKRKTNYEIFSDILSYRVLNDFSKELAVIKFNNDTLTAILSSLDRLDPSVSACIIQELLTRVTPSENRGWIEGGYPQQLSPVAQRRILHLHHSHPYPQEDQDRDAGVRP